MITTTTVTFQSYIEGESYADYCERLFNWEADHDNKEHTITGT